jgi:hypothetical protein
MSNVVEYPVRTNDVQDKTMPPKSKFNRRRVIARLDEKSERSMDALLEIHKGKDESTLIREALNEKAERDAELQNTSKQSRQAS